MWRGTGCAAALLTLTCCGAQSANIAPGAGGNESAEYASAACTFNATLDTGWQQSSAYYNTLHLWLTGQASQPIAAPYQVTAAGPTYTQVTRTWGWNVTNADSQGVRGNVTDPNERLDGSYTVELAAIVVSNGNDLMPTSVLINGQSCSPSGSTKGSTNPNSVTGTSPGSTSGSTPTSRAPTTNPNSGSPPTGGTTPSADDYTQDQLLADITTLANGGGQAGYGNPANAALWNSASAAELLRSIKATHDAMWSFMSLRDFVHMGLAQAAAESTMDPSHYDGTSMGLLQCTAPTNGAEFNQHGKTVTAADGSVVLSPTETITNTNLQDPGKNWVVWAWTMRVEGGTGETPHEVSLGQSHAPADWTGTVHDAMRAWLSGAGWGYSPSDYAARGPFYFTKVQTYMNLIAPGDFDRLMAVHIPSGKVPDFSDPGAGY